MRSSSAAAASSSTSRAWLAETADIAGNRSEAYTGSLSLGWRFTFLGREEIRLGQGALDALGTGVSS